MLKDNSIRILYLDSFSMLLFFAGCVDTSVQPIPSKIDFRSEVKVVNFAVGSANFILRSTADNGANVDLGTLALGDESPAASQQFLNIPSGTKELDMAFGTTLDTLKFAADTDKKMRLFVVDEGTKGLKLVKSVQRYVWQTKDSPTDADLYPKDSSFISFFNGSPDASVDGIGIKGAQLDTVIDFSSALKVGEGVGYMEFKSGDYDFVILSGADTLTSFNYTLASQKRYSAAVYDVIANLKNKVFIDD